MSVQKIPTTKVMTQNETANVKTHATESNKAGTEAQTQKEKLYVPTKNKEMLKDAVEEANSKLKLSNSRCEYRFVEEANRIAIKIIDNDSNEVIKEIPSEETLKAIESLREMTGLLIDQQL